jgi:hypothetical protein
MFLKYHNLGKKINQEEDMKKFMLFLIVAVMFAGVAFASVNVLSDGTNLGPAQDINFTGGTVTGNGPVKTVDMATITDNVTVTGSVTIDGSIYTATLAVDGAIYPGGATSDPCGTLGAGYIFFNRTAGQPCYCNSAGVDLMLYNGSTACF